jgi:hypothetical protein
MISLERAGTPAADGEIQGSDRSGFLFLQLLLSRTPAALELR